MAWHASVAIHPAIRKKPARGRTGGLFRLRTDWEELSAAQGFSGDRRRVADRSTHGCHAKIRKGRAGAFPQGSPNLRRSSGARSGSPAPAARAGGPLDWKSPVRFYRIRTERAGARGPVWTLGRADALALRRSPVCLVVRASCRPPVKGQARPGRCPCNHKMRLSPRAAAKLPILRPQGPL